MDWLILDWLILVLVTPVIIVVVVLLYGFVGCGYEGVATGPSSNDTKPSMLTVTAIGTDRMRLVWHDNSGGAATSFKVERFEPNPPPGAPPGAGGGFKVIDPDASSPFTDGGRNDGTDYTYRVRAVLAGVSYDSAPSDEVTATTHPNAPSNLRLTPKEVDEIDLQWDHVTKSTKTINFKVEHRPKGVGIFMPLHFGTEKTFPHTGLTAGSEHEYQVTAVVDGFVNSAPVSSTPAPGSAKTWAVAFGPVVLNVNQAGLEGSCLVQRIRSSLLKSSGTKVRITLRGASAGKLSINRVYISQAASVTGPDAAADITKVVDLVELPVVSPDPTAITLEVNYTLDQTKDLLIAFDIKPKTVLADNWGNVRAIGTAAAPFTGAPHYFKPDTQLAASKLRPGLSQGAFERLYLVEKIKVL